MKKYGMGMPHDKRRLYRKMINCVRPASSRLSVPNEVIAASFMACTVNLGQESGFDCVASTV